MTTTAGMSFLPSIPQLTRPFCSLSVSFSNNLFTSDTTPACRDPEIPDQKGTYLTHSPAPPQKKARNIQLHTFETLSQCTSLWFLPTSQPRRSSGSLLRLPVVGRDGYVEAAVAVQESRMRAVQLDALFMHNEHWDLCAILAGVENLEQKREQIQYQLTLACFQMGETCRQPVPWVPDVKHLSVLRRLCGVKCWKVGRPEFEFLLHKYLIRLPWVSHLSSLASVLQP